MTANEARDLVAKFKTNGTEIGKINFEIKKLAEQGRTTYRHEDTLDPHLSEVLAYQFRLRGFNTHVEDRYHPRGVIIYNLVIDWS